MKRMYGMALVLAAAACASRSGSDAIPGTDVPFEAEGVVDEGFADVPDEPVDPGADAVLEAGPDVPSHAAVFEQLSHPGCLPDGGHVIDRVLQYRDATTLADLDVRAVAVAGGFAWLGTATGLFVAGPSDAAFRGIDLPGGPAAIADVAPAAEGGVLVARGAFVYTVDPEGTFAVVASTTTDVARVFACGGAVYALAGGALVMGEGGAFGPVEPPGEAIVRAGACANGSPWVGAADGLWKRDAGAWARAWIPARGAPVTALAARGAFVAAAAGDEVAVLHGGDAVEVRVPGIGGLPTGNVRAVDLSEDGAVLVVGHDIGVTRVDRASGAVEHFHSLRWLPAESVTSVALDPGTLSILVGTPGGAARLDKAQTTLADKAGRMLGQLDRWFWRLSGFVSANAVFPDPWSDGPVVLNDDDNDGQWTEEAVGAFCYAYRATGDERYYQAARKAVTNMALQIDIPAQDFIAAGLGRGFVTRSFVRDDEGGVFASKATQPNWHLVHYADGHDYYWKDDTSSDEVTGHFYGLSIYHDLCAKDDEERAFVADHLAALAGFILDHGFMLVDLDGLPTSDGRWDPGALAVAVDGLQACSDAGHTIVECIDAWGGGAFLNSVEILGGMLAAWHVSGQARFLDAYESLVTASRYGELATFNDNVATWAIPGSANYGDHELADLAFLTLLRYEPHPDRRQQWVDSMVEAWQYEVGERNPLKSLALASVLADPPGLAEGVRTLVDHPEDLRQVRMDNGHRLDVARNGTGRFGEPQFGVVLPYDEIQAVRWDSNPYRIDGGDSPQVRRSPSFWMLPYWGLRYYRAICPLEGFAGNEDAR